MSFDLLPLLIFNQKFKGSIGHLGVLLYLVKYPIQVSCCVPETLLYWPITKLVTLSSHQIALSFQHAHITFEIHQGLRKLQIEVELPIF